MSLKPLDFDAALVLPGARSHQSVGRRARVERTQAGLSVAIDAAAPVVVAGPRADAGMDRVFPFGLEREMRTTDVSLTQRIYVPPDAPWVAIEWAVHSGSCVARAIGPDRDGVEVRWEGATTVNPDDSVVLGTGLSRLLVGRLDGIDAEASVAAAHAAARRRTRHRPLSRTGPDDAERPDTTRADPFAVAERALRGAAPATADEPLLVPALLALNDRPAARNRLTAVRDPAARALAAGAWAAWTGDAEALESVRPGLLDWLDGAEGAEGVERAARAFAPVLHELLGGAPADRPRERAGGDAAGALVAATQPVPARPAGVDPERDRAIFEVVREMHGRWGVVPDAARGRVRLAFDAANASLANLTVGDAALSFECSLDRQAGRASIVATQQAGQVPLTLILEPRIPGASRVREARIDGRPADLDAQSDGTGIGTRVQLVCDDRRELILDFE